MKKIPIWTWRHAVQEARISVGAKAFCYTLANDISDTGRYTIKSVPELMYLLNVSNLTISRYIKEAEKCGLIKVKSRYKPNGGRLPNSYFPCFPEWAILDPNPAQPYDDSSFDEPNDPPMPPPPPARFDGPKPARWPSPKTQNVDSTCGGQDVESTCRGRGVSEDLDPPPSKCSLAYKEDLFLDLSGKENLSTCESSLRSDSHMSAPCEKEGEKAESEPEEASESSSAFACVGKAAKKQKEDSPAAEKKPRSKKSRAPQWQRSSYTPEFEAFWQACPRAARRCGKVKPFEIWTQMDEETRAAVAAAAPFWADRMKGTPDDKVAHVTTWLNQRRWEAEDTKKKVRWTERRNGVVEHFEMDADVYEEEQRVKAEKLQAAIERDRIENERIMEENRKRDEEYMQQERLRRKHTDSNGKLNIDEYLSAWGPEECPSF